MATGALFGLVNGRRFMALAISDLGLGTTGACPPRARDSNPRLRRSLPSHFDLAIERQSLSYFTTVKWESEPSIDNFPSV